MLTAVAALAALLAAPQWPACDVVTGSPGGPAILIDGAPHTPLFFVVNNQFGRDDVLVEEIRQAADAGIKLFTFNVRLGWQHTAEQAAEIIDKFCAAHPDGYFYVRTWLGPSRKWLEEHPDDRIAKANGERLNLASPSSEAWRADSKQMLQDRIREIITSPHGHRFIGVGLGYLQTAEWFYPDTNDFMDYSPANLAAFRAWLKRSYKKDKALRKAWGDPDVTIDTAAFPTPEFRDAAHWGAFRHPVAHRPAIDMQRFQSDLIADTIAYFAEAVKEVTQDRSLVGVFYGYTIELNNNGPRALAHSGHLALARLLDCPHIDILQAPYSYFQRAIGQPGHLHAPVDSILLHGKLHIGEEDTYTHLAQAPDPHLKAPGWKDRTTTSAETLAVVCRNFANFAAHRCGTSIFDLLADGRWRDQQFWRTVPLLYRILAELRSAPPFHPEVACVIDEASPHYLRANTWPILIHACSWWRAELDRIGTPVAYYLQSDLPRIPESVKILILANPFHIARDERRAIERFLKRGATVVWTYAPNIATTDALDPDRIAEATGIHVAPKFDDVSTVIISEITDETASIDPQAWRPRFIVTDENIDVVARYKATGEVSAAARPYKGGISLYTATPRLPVGLLREICLRARVHLYRDTPGMTTPVGDYLFVHTDHPATHTFSWPTPPPAVERVTPHGPAPVPLDPDHPNQWTDTLPGNCTAIYHLAPTFPETDETDLFPRLLY